MPNEPTKNKEELGGPAGKLGFTEVDRMGDDISYTSDKISQNSSSQIWFTPCRGVRLPILSIFTIYAPLPISESSSKWGKQLQCNFCIHYKPLCQVYDQKQPISQSSHTWRTIKYIVCHYH